MVCYGCFAFFLLLGGLLVTLVGYYPLDMDHRLVHILCTLILCAGYVLWLYPFP